MSANFFAVAPDLNDITRLQNRVASLEFVVSELLCVLHDNGTLETEEARSLEDRLGL